MKRQFRRMSAAVAITAASLGVVSGYEVGRVAAVSGPMCSGLTAIGVGQSHAFALHSDGTVWGYGNNQRGQLGVGNPNVNRPTPVAVAGLDDAAAVAGGLQFTIALFANGVVKTAGLNGYGQLGDGTLNERRTPVSTGITDAVAVDAGGSHGIALANDGTVWTWGRNVEGQLGNGSNTGSSVPVKVTGLANVTKVAAGWNHSLAVKSDGTVWAWGYGTDGQLGNGARLSSTTPVQVSGLTGATVIDGGANYSMAVLSDGTVKTWGANAVGQLGFPGGLKTTPTKIPTLSGITDAAAGSFHGIATDGVKTWTWGSNSVGQLGIDLLPQQPRPANSNVPYEVAAAAGASAVAAGSSTSYALRSGTVWAWGEGASGELGNGATAESDKPVQSGCPTAQTTAPAWAVAMAAEPPVAAPGAPVTLYAVANQDVAPSPYAIQLFDKASGVRLASCATGVMCTAVATSAVPTTRSFVAYVAAESLTAPPPFVQAASELSVMWGPSSPGPWSTSCTSPTTTIVDTETEQLKVQQVSEDETWVCFRQSSNAEWIGGRVTIISPSVAYPPVTADDQSTACTTTPGNQAPGPHPLIAQEGVAFDTYANATEAWVCLTTDQLFPRVVVKAQHAPPAVVLNLDGV